VQVTLGKLEVCFGVVGIDLDGIGELDYRLAILTFAK